MISQSSRDAINGRPVTESVSDRLLRLPFYADLTEADQALVVDTVRGFAG